MKPSLSNKIRPSATQILKGAIVKWVRAYSANMSPVWKEEEKDNVKNKVREEEKGQE